MIINRELADFTIILLKCFFILVFFGFFLPKLFDFILYYYICKPNSYDNSMLVNSIVNKNIDIINNYVTVFKDFLRF